MISNARTKAPEPGNGKTYAWLVEHAGYQGDDCLKWPFGSETKSGRGVLGVSGENYWAHRLMCMLAHGEPPTAGHTAAHSCGKGHEGCVNPRHLSWKTQSENLIDCRIHGTTPKQFHGIRGRLKPEEVDCIRLLRGVRTQRVIAQMFNVSEGAVNDIWNGRSHARPPKINIWTDAEDASLREHIGQRMTVPQIATAMGKSPGSIIGRMGELGLKSQSGWHTRGVDQAAIRSAAS